MKKRSFIILLIFIFIISVPISVFARAGGGGSGGSGGGSGGSGGSSSSSSSSYYNNSNDRNRRSNPLGSIIGTIVVISIIARNNITKRISVIINNRKARTVLRRLRNEGYQWNYNEIEKRVEVIFFKVQEAWTNNDMSIAREFVSDKIYELYNSKLQWMRINNKRNVLDKIRLLESKPVGVVSFINEENDFIWFYVRASLIDYTMNEMNGQVVEGKTTRTRFDEYWKFIWGENGWVLDEILQTDEIEGNGYFYSSVEEKDKLIK